MKRKRMQILADGKGDGYTDSYLASRLRGRTAVMVSRWDALARGAMTPEELVALRYGGASVQRSYDHPWSEYRKEVAWVYHQMNRRMRERMYPLLVWLSFHAVLDVLRLKNGEDTGELVTRVVQESILHPSLKSALLGAPTLADAVRVTAVHLLDGDGSQQVKLLQTDGLQAVEQELEDALFQEIQRTAETELMRSITALLMDLRNMMMTYKAVRWKSEQSPRPQKGGTVGTAQYDGIYAREDMPRLARIVGKTLGMQEDAVDFNRMEQQFLARLQNRLRKLRVGCEPDTVTVYHLFAGYCEARNLATLLSVKRYGMDAVMNALI